MQKVDSLGFFDIYGLYFVRGSCVTIYYFNYILLFLYHLFCFIFNKCYYCAVLKTLTEHVSCLWQGRDKNWDSPVFLLFISLCLLYTSKCLQYCYYFFFFLTCCMSLMYSYITNVTLITTFFSACALHWSPTHLGEFLLLFHIADKSNLLLAVSNAKFNLETQILGS